MYQIIAPDNQTLTAFFNEYPAIAYSSDLYCLTPSAYSEALIKNHKKAIYPEWAKEPTTPLTSETEKFLYQELMQIEESTQALRAPDEPFDEVVWNFQMNKIIILNIKAAATIAESFYKYERKNISQKSLLILSHSDYKGFNFSGAMISDALKLSLCKYGIKTETLRLSKYLTPSPFSDNIYEYIPNYWDKELSRRWRGQTINNLISIAGLFYPRDKKKLAHIVNALRAPPWVLNPPFWNNLVESDLFRPSLLIKDVFSTMPGQTQRHLSEIIKEISECTFRGISNILRHEQAVTPSRLYHFYVKHSTFQILTWLGISTLFEQNPRATLILGALDGGINGPLASAAMKNTINCEFVPHSAVANLMVTCFGTIHTEYWQPNPVATPSTKKSNVVYYNTSLLSKPLSATSEIQNIEKVLILHNGTHAMLSTQESINFIINTIKNIELEIGARGLVYNHRLKPGDQTPFDAYANLLQFKITEHCQPNNPTSLAKDLDQHQLVVSVGLASSALWEALEAGRPVVHISNRQLLKTDLIDDNVINSLNIQDGLAVIREVLDNTESGKNYVRRQRSKFLQVMANTNIKL